MSTATMDAPATSTPETTPASSTPAPQVPQPATPTPAAVPPAVAGDAAAAPGATPQAAPVEYALTLPQDSFLEPSAVERVTAFAKAEHLAPVAAQKVLDLAQAENAAFVEKQKADYTAKITGWETAVKADPELGGANFSRTLTRTVAVLDRFGDQELKEALKSTGFGNYPALVRFVDKIGAAMANDGIVNSGHAASDTKPIADLLYPSSAGK